MEWINIEDQLPPLGEEVMIWQKAYKIAHLYLGYYGKRWSGEDIYEDFFSVKYWTHLPKPPEGDK